DDQLELRGLLHREVGGLRALQNAGGVGRRAPPKKTPPRPRRPPSSETGRTCAMMPIVRTGSAGCASAASGTSTTQRTRIPFRRLPGRLAPKSPRSLGSPLHCAL